MTMLGRMGAAERAMPGLRMVIQAHADDLDAVVTRYSCEPTVEEWVRYGLAFVEGAIAQQACRGRACTYDAEPVHPVGCVGAELHARRERGGLVLRWGDCPRKRLWALRRRTERGVKAARMPAGLRAQTFATYRPHEGCRNAIDAVLRGDSVVLSGPSGVGKTHLAAAAVNALLGEARMALFVTVPDLMDELRAAQRDAERAGRIQRALEQAELLVLDDLGAERQTDYSREAMYRIVNGRVTHERRLIVTTNLETPEALEEHIGGETGERVVRRLVAHCAWHAMERGRDGAG